MTDRQWGGVPDDVGEQPYAVQGRGRPHPTSFPAAKVPVPLIVY